MLRCVVLTSPSVCMSEAIVTCETLHVFCFCFCFVCTIIIPLNSKQMNLKKQKKQQKERYNGSHAALEI